MYLFIINWILFSKWKIIKDLILILINFKLDYLMKHEIL